jgi:hypothetical protein
MPWPIFPFTAVQDVPQVRYVPGAELDLFRIFQLLLGAELLLAGQLYLLARPLINRECSTVNVECTQQGEAVC